MSDTIQDEMRYACKANAELAPLPRGLMLRAAAHIDALLDKTRLQQEYIEGLPSTPDGSHHNPKPGEMSIADRVYGLEEAVSQLGDEPFEWLTLPWGGAVRKTEVAGVFPSHQGSAGPWMVNLMFGDGSEKFFEADDPDEAKAWLADIESQLGIVR